MGKLEEQRKEIELKLTQIKCLEAIKKNLKPITEGEEFKSVSGEVNSWVEGYINSEIKLIEEGEPEPEPGESEDLSSEDTLILKQLVSQVKSKAAAPKPVAPQLKPVDPVRFAMDNKHLDGKRVRIETKDGPIKGKVHGVNPSNQTLVIQTDTGYEIEVPPSQVSVI